MSLSCVTERVLVVELEEGDRRGQVHSRRAPLVLIGLRMRCVSMAEWLP